MWGIVRGFSGLGRLLVPLCYGGVPSADGSLAFENVSENTVGKAQGIGEGQGGRADPGERGRSLLVSFVPISAGRFEGGRQVDASAS